MLSREIKTFGLGGFEAMGVGAGRPLEVGNPALWGFRPRVNGRSFGTTSSVPFRRTVSTGAPVRTQRFRRLARSACIPMCALGVTSGADAQTQRLGAGGGALLG